MAKKNIDIELIKNKDAKALERIYNNYSSALYGVILRICNNDELAQEILQDTFLTIWEKAEQYNNEKASFFTWAMRIARNKSLNALRKSNKHIQTEELSVYNLKESLVNNENGKQEQNAELNIRIKSLEAHHQRALELVYFNGLTHAEAHEEMQVPLGTFKSYVRQAIKALSKQMGIFLLGILNY